MVCSSLVSLTPFKVFNKSNTSLIGHSQLDKYWIVCGKTKQKTESNVWFLLASYLPTPEKNTVTHFTLQNLSLIIMAETSLAPLLSQTNQHYISLTSLTGRLVGRFH